MLLLKAENKGQLPGIIHGTSGSGASLFVEPLPAVELNNDIVQLQDQERNEVLRILQGLYRRARGTTPFDLLAEAVEELRVRAVIRQRHPGGEQPPPRIDLGDGRELALELGGPVQPRAHVGSAGRPPGP